MSEQKTSALYVDPITQNKFDIWVLDQSETMVRESFKSDKPESCGKGV